MATSSNRQETQTRKKRDRADTERKLIDVALDLIRNNGVLAGLNLRQVAKGAGVNRGNIYHYFGSRQELLRAAISHEFTGITSALAANGKPRTFIETRLRHFLAKRSTRDSELRALLVIDGDDSVDPMPLFESAISQLHQEVINGDIDRGHDGRREELCCTIPRSVTKSFFLFRVDASHCEQKVISLDLDH